MNNFLAPVVKWIYDNRRDVETFLLIAGFGFSFINIVSTSVSRTFFYATVLYVMNSTLKYIKIASEIDDEEKAVSPYALILTISTVGGLIIAFFICNALNQKSVGDLAVKLSVVLIYMIVFFANIYHVRTE